MWTGRVTAICFLTGFKGSVGAGCDPVRGGGKEGGECTIKEVQKEIKHISSTYILELSFNRTSKRSVPHGRKRIVSHGNMTHYRLFDEKKTRTKSR